MPGVIRLASIADAPAIQRIYAPFVTDRVTSFEATPPDATEIAHRIGTPGDGFPWLVYEDAGGVVGYAYAAPHAARHAYRWSVNVSVYLDPRVHRRGIGRALYLALFDVLRRQQYVNAYGGITLPNAASEGLHRSVGFVPVGIYRGVGFKFGQWWDVAWMHLRLREDATPAEPQPFPAIVAGEDVRARFIELAEAIRR
jgi:phosphinothricin acetyltransferase